MENPRRARQVRKRVCGSDYGAQTSSAKERNPHQSVEQNGAELVGLAWRPSFVIGVVQTVTWLRLTQVQPNRAPRQSVIVLVFEFGSYVRADFCQLSLAHFPVCFHCQNFQC